MATLEQFNALAKAIIEKFGAHSENLHEAVIAFRVPGAHTEIARLIYLAEQQAVAITFQIELTPTDSIQIWDWSRRHFRKMTSDPAKPEDQTGQDLHLMSSYFIGMDKTVYTGLDAQIMVEQDRQNRYVKAIQQNSEVKEDARVQQAEWEVEQAQRTGKKITFH